MEDARLRAYIICHRLAQSNCSPTRTSPSFRHRRFRVPLWR